MKKENLLADDLDHVLEYTRGLWEELRGHRLFITGGTGFFGCWLLESFAWANERLGLNASAVVLTRNVDAFRRKAPHLAAHPAIRFHVGDIQTFDFPQGQFLHIIHAATEASAKLNEEDPLQMFDTVVQGTRRVLEFARCCSVQRLLLTSSGTIYGMQPPEITHVTEDYPGAPSPTNAAFAYHEGKRAAELLCSLYDKQHGIAATVARGFAFVGPYLPLDRHFAIGNFIRDGLKGDPIQVNGDGTPFRSYLYAADLAIWLWTILFRGQRSRAYNVGSEIDLPIRHVAQLVATAFQPPRELRVARQPAANQLRDAYVPSTRRAREELGLGETVDLREAIKRTIEWHRARS